MIEATTNWSCFLPSCFTRNMPKSCNRHSTVTGANMSMYEFARLPIAIRAYAAPQFVELKEPSTRRKKQASRLPPSPSVVVFDTETTAAAAQSLRFGTYQVRENGELYESGIFYDPEGVTDEELEVLEVLHVHADMHGLRLITHAAFVEEVFYSIGYDRHAAIVGFNLPFDISRIAIQHASARGKMRGGFTFNLSPIAWVPPNRARPNVQVKHISRRSAFIQFASAGQPQSGASQSKKRPGTTRRGHFIDIRTLAGALFAQSFSLATLGEHLGVEHPKLDYDEFREAISDTMLTYAVRDAQTTWECYAALIERFDRFGLAATGPNRIYSEASIGKAYLRDMGVAGAIDGGSSSADALRVHRAKRL